MPVVTQIQVRRGTAANWTSTNPTLSAGEFGFETDTLKLKCGNGSTAWNSLAYTGNDGDITGVTAGTGISGGGTSGTVTVSIDTSVTADLTTAQTLTNKTLTTPIISSISNSGTVTLPTGSVTLASLTGTETFTNKTIDAASNTLTGVVTLTGAQTLTNKTLTTPTLDAPLINLGYSAKTANYTVALADNGYLFSMNNASATTFSIPTNASVAFPVGAQISFAWITGAGQPSIAAVTSGTTTILSTGAISTAPKLRAVNSTATAVKIATDIWLVMGDIA